MADKFFKSAKKMAQSSIYDGVEYIGEWNGYAIYEPIFDDDESHCVGFPSFILANDKGLRWTYDWEESRKIMHKLYHHDADDD